MPKIKLPWKKNLRKIPESIRLKIKDSLTHELKVECLKRLRPADIRAGNYAHLGIALKDQAVSFLPHLLPDADVGRYSNWNRNGREIVRRDLPKTTKTFGPYEIPIYGDPSKGYCDVYIPRKVYPRDQVPAQELQIAVSFLEQEAGTGDFVMGFRVDVQLNRTHANFEEQLFYCLNLLQENVGRIDVWPADETLAHHLAIENVNWDLLPPGESTRERLLSLFHGSTAEIQSTVAARYDLLNSLSPIVFINGTRGFDRYFGAKFSEDTVVFENMEYGNAIYVMDHRWRELSQRSRGELLKERPGGFLHRLPHNGGWENRIRQIIDSRRT